MNQKKFTSGKDFLETNRLDGGVSALESTDAEQTPPVEELAEVHTPDLSDDTFRIENKEFKIKVSNIKTQKIMAKSMGAINDLLSKINIRPIMEKFREKMNRADQRSMDALKELKGKTEEELAEEFQKIQNGLQSSDNDFYVDFADLAKEIILAGGLDNILISIMDLLTGVVYAICKGQDEAVTREWVEEHTHFNQNQEIFFKQMQKDEMQGRVIDFLALAIRLVTQRAGSI